MFSWLNKQGVRSDQGFEVQRTGRFDVEYSEGEHKVTLYVEPGVSGGMPSLSVSPDAFQRWDGAPPGALLAPEMQARLFANLRAALEFQGLQLVVEEGV